MLKVTIVALIPEVGQESTIPYIKHRILRSGLGIKSIVMKGKTVEVTLDSLTDDERNTDDQPSRHTVSSPGQP